jgi:hypothetical protein
MNQPNGTDSATRTFLASQNHNLNKTTKRAPVPEINSRTEDIGKYINIGHN